MSTLEIELQNVKKENQKLLDTAQQKSMALEDIKAKLRMSFHEKEWDCSAIKEQLHTCEQLLQEKDHSSQQLVRDIMSILHKFLANQQETDTCYHRNTQKTKSYPTRWSICKRM